MNGLIYSSRDQDRQPLLARSSTSLSSYTNGAPPKHTPSLSRTLKTFVQSTNFLIPTFLRPAPKPNDDNGNPVITTSKKHSTEYLDGVRGIASVIVFNFHWIHIFYPSSNWGYGYGDNESLWLLPFIRVVFSGAAMVSIFFVVSGFVLTHRYIQRMHAREYDSLYPSLTSLAFRRAWRLYLPSLISAIINYLLTSMGLLETPKTVHDKEFHHGPKAFLEFLDLHSNPLSWHYEVVFMYNTNLWSIGVEYRGSMVIFLMVLTLARCSTLIRFLVEGFCLIYSFGHRRWDVSLFIAGMLMAELDVLVSKSPARESFVKGKLFRGVMVIIFLLGIYISGYPSKNSTETPGYDFTKDIWPFSNYRRRLWLSIAAICIVLPMQFLSSLRWFFTCRPVKYFGQVSFALYLVHDMMNHAVGMRIRDLCAKMLGDNGDRLSPAAFALTTVLYFPIVFWVADVFWRAVDIPCTDFAKWLERKCLA